MVVEHPRGGIPFDHEALLQQGETQFAEMFRFKSKDFRNSDDERNTRNDLDKIRKAIIRFINTQIPNVDWSDREAIDRFCDVLSDEIETHSERFNRALSRVQHGNPIARWQEFTRWINGLRHETKDGVLRQIDEAEALAAAEARKSAAIERARQAQLSTLSQATSTFDSDPDDFGEDFEPEQELVEEPIELAIIPEKKPKTPDETLIEGLFDALGDPERVRGALDRIKNATDLVDPRGVRDEALDILVSFLAEGAVVKREPKREAASSDDGVWDELETAMQEAEELQAELERRDERMKQQSAELETLRRARERLDKRLQEIEKSNEEKDGRIARLEAQITRLAKTIDSLETELGQQQTDDQTAIRLRQERERLQEARTASEQEYEAFKQQVEAERKAWQQEREELERRSAKVDYTTMKEQLADSIAELEDHISELTEISFGIVSWAEQTRAEMEKFILTRGLTHPFEKKADALLKDRVEQEIRQAEMVKDEVERNVRIARDRVEELRSRLHAMSVVEKETPQSELEVDQGALDAQIDGLSYRSFEEMRLAFQTTQSEAVRPVQDSVQRVALRPEISSFIRELPYPIEIVEADIERTKEWEELFASVKGLDVETIRLGLPFRHPEKLQDYYNELLEDLRGGTFETNIKIAFTVLGAMRRQGGQDFSPRLARDVALAMKLRDVKIVEALGPETTAVTRALLKAEILGESLGHDQLIGRKNVGSKWGMGYDLTTSGKGVSQVWTAELLENKIVTPEQLRNIYNWITTRELERKLERKK